ncbi:serum response factor b isoform X5 [Cololabis saira]|uniref:serum response factor b isoform X5 n=1 Tax=Cololabis saira TaxID=129043 RepID=UPI002AD39FE7|nr:serum response factor b isoform X5 [Cololabis saira]
MLPSQVGSAPPGSGSAAPGRGVRPVLVRAGGVEVGSGMLAGSRGPRPGSLQPGVHAHVLGLNPEAAPLCSGSDNDSDSGDEDEPAGSLLGQDGRSRGVKRERADLDAQAAGQDAGAAPGGYGMVAGGVAGAKPGKKTRGRVKIKMEFIDNKLRRYTTFSKRKTGIMKKAYELSTLTGTQVLLLVASETGHVYTFATRKLQPMITSETGKALIQTCLNSPDSPPRSDPSMDQRMSATGFEETDLTYQVSESESMGDTKDTLKPTFTVASLPGSTSNAQSTVPTTSTTMQVSSGPSFPITNYLAPVSVNSNISANGTVLKTAGGSAGVMQLPGGFTFMPATASLPATIVTSSVPTSVAGHMMYPSPHAVMYASTPALADGGLAVLNAFSQGTSAMQVSHAQAQDTGAVPQVFLTAPPGTVQIPVSAVQLHPMVIGQQSSGSSSNLTELQVVNLDAAQNSKSD